ncbi:MAG: hypothetical protein K2N06_11850 [Oscillospiraceae bacterium]|nr:hypothetical protein [Oscillospiraceae bacterium]
MDISRIADIGTISQTSQTRSVERRTEDKASTLATEHTDSFVKSEAAFMPAYTKKSAQKQTADNNLLQKENSERTIDKVEESGEQVSRGELMTKGISHIIRAMFVKQGEVLLGSVPSIGAKMYAEELLSQLRALYGNSAAEENTPEYWQPDETAARMLMFFDSVELGEGTTQALGNRENTLERSFLSAFNETEQLFGGRGRLPLESYETKRLVLESYFAKAVL